MEYEGQICRTPMERAAYKLPVMVGCVYNKCKFCTLFKHLKFRLIPMEEIEEDIKRVHNAGGSPRKIFLGDGSAFALDTDHLIEILELIHRYFPDCNEINMNATISSILGKKDSELQALYDNGVRHLYIGLESGLEDVLESMNKGNTVKQLVEAAERMKKFGFFFDAHMMTGAAGKGRAEENASATASALIAANASSVTNFSMFIHHETPLYQDVLEGKFTAASEYENLVEDKHLIELLSESLSEKEGQVIKYESFHDYIAFHVWGVLPHDKEAMINKINRTLKERADLEKTHAVIGPEDTFSILIFF